MTPSSKRVVARYIQANGPRLADQVARAISQAREDLVEQFGDPSTGIEGEAAAHWAGNVSMAVGRLAKHWDHMIAKMAREGWTADDIMYKLKTHRGLSRKLVDDMAKAAGIEREFKQLYNLIEDARIEASL
jgi:hypothetical protein